MSSGRLFIFWPTTAPIKTTKSRTGTLQRWDTYVEKLITLIKQSKIQLPKWSSPRSSWAPDKAQRASRPPSKPSKTACLSFKPWCRKPNTTTQSFKSSSTTSWKTCRSKAHTLRFSSSLNWSVHTWAITRKPYATWPKFTYKEGTKPPNSTYNYGKT